MKKIYFTLLLLFSVLSINAQKVDYDNTSKWFLGFNIGGTWSSTDVKSQTSTGYGLVLGKSFNYRYGSIISFDLRARYLRGTWNGQDNDTTSLANYTGTALNPYTNTQGFNGPGFTVNNFQSDVHRLALELALHLNRFRETSGWDPYIFGGVGLTWKQTYGNLYNQNDSLTLYDYSSMLNNGPIGPQLSSTLDKIYDTPLDGSTNKYKAYFMPSLGFGIGYQIGKRVSLGIEHKTTFTRGDDFDGYASTTPRLKNDIYHYTSAYLTFRFRTRGEATTPSTEGGNSSGAIGNFNSNCNSPVITFNSVNNQVVSYALYKLYANITEIDNPQNITVLNSNNQAIAFNYNASTKSLTADFNLVEGVNTFTITAQNNCGKDIKQISLTYNPCLSPVISFTNPASNQTVKNSNFTVNALITKVANSTDIQLYQNNVRINAFSYNPTTGLLTSNIILVPGLNTFKIDATNNCGTISSTASITFDNCVSPVVQLINPSTTGTTSSLSVLNIQAIVKNVLSADDITITQNNITKRNFTFVNNQIVLSTSLVNGINTFTITAKSSCGTANETFTIDYEDCAAPVVTVNSPINNSTVTAATLQLKAKIDNISSKQNVSLKLNGIAVTNFAVNNATKSLESALTLLPGVNIISLGAINTCGSDIETIYVTYDNCVKPAVSISNVNTTVSNAAYLLNATVLNATNTQEISLTQNGIAVNFNFTGNQVSSALTLVPGNNTFVLKATRPCGSDTKTLIVMYNNCVAPFINILNPSISGATVNTSAITFRANVVNANAAQEIVVKQNNQVIPFNFANGIVEATTNLVSGLNTFSITSTNACGSDTKSVSITYVSCTPPSIVISNPAATNSTVNYAQYAFKANVTGTTNTQSIGVKLNGQTVAFNLANGVLTANLSLNPAINSIIVSASNECGTDIETTTINYDNCFPPKITLSGIPNLTQTVSNQQFSITGTMTGITSSQNVSFTQNGVSKGFVYQNGNFSANVLLTEGLNTIVITSTNSCGVDIKTLNITYISCSAPTAIISNPITSGTTVTNPTFNFSASVQNIETAQGISVKLNGVVITNFTYLNGLLQANLTLQNGVNNITLTGTNACGVVTETTTLTYNLCKTPVVTFNKPITGGTTVANAIFNFSAKVQNCTSPQDVLLKLNGTTVTNYTFVNGILQANVTLQNGLNTFTVTGTNACGTATESTTISLSNCIPPSISFTNPVASGSTVNAAIYNFRASVSNVTATNGISLKLNGVAVTNFTFLNGNLVANLTLQEGLNTIAVTGTNACGVANENTTINLITCLPISIAIKNPSSNGSTVSVANYNFKATVANIANSAGISLKLNGVAVTNFTFLNGNLEANVTLQNGLNTFTITGTNACGAVSESTTLNCNICVPPSIAITHPDGNSTSVETVNYNFKASILNVQVASGISLKLNGVSVTNFTYSNGILDANLTLQAGLNTIAVSVTNACGVANESTTINFIDCIRPNVEITYPNENAITVTSSTLNFIANVQNVSSAQGISLQLNGSAISNFNFFNGIVQETVNLQPGVNTFTISVTNACGNETATSTVIYNNCVPPRVVITQPTVNGTTVENATFNFKATVQNVNSAQGVSLQLNGTSVTNFNYANGTVQANVNLQSGLNTFTITVTNNCGTSTESSSITLNNCIPPTIVINPTFTRGSTYSYFFSATATNVPTSQGISFTLNGNPVNFSYDNGNIQTTLNLQNGPNTLHLTATNACGNAIKDTIINFGSCIPAVNFNMNVENGSSTTNPTFDFTATVENYSETTAVIVKINGNTASGYNNTNGLISGSINLPFGATTIEITAANSCGTDTKTFTINRCNLITFGLVQPATNNTTVTFPNQLIQFNVFNSDNQTAITISQNGNGLQGFTRTGSLVQGTAVLVNGTNQFQVNISDNCNQITENFTVIYDGNARGNTDGRGVDTTGNSRNNPRPNGGRMNNNVNNNGGGNNQTPNSNNDGGQTNPVNPPKTNVGNTTPTTKPETPTPAPTKPNIGNTSPVTKPQNTTPSTPKPNAGNTSPVTKPQDTTPTPTKVTNQPMTPAKPKVTPQVTPKVDPPKPTPTEQNKPATPAKPTENKPIVKPEIKPINKGGGK